MGMSSTTLTTSASAMSSTYSCAGARANESSTAAVLACVSGMTGAATMGSAVIGDTGRACSWAEAVTGVGAEMGSLTGASDVWGAGAVVGGADGLSGTR